MNESHGSSDVEDGRIMEGAPPAQLYDLASDPAETTNLYDARPEVAARMKTLLAETIPGSQPPEGPAQETLDAFRNEAGGYATTKNFLKVRYDQPLTVDLIRRMAEHKLEAVSQRDDDSFW